MITNPRSRPKVLSLVWFKIYPALFGGQKGIALFNKYLGQKVDLDCLCSGDNQVVPDAGCAVLPELTIGKAQFYNPLNWLKLYRGLRCKGYNYVIVEFPYYGLLVWLLKRKSTKLIIHTHNIEAERFKSFGNRGWHFLKRYEGWCLRKASLVLFKTEADQRYAIREYALYPEKTYLLPYGVERPTMIDKTAAKKNLERKHGIGPNEKLLLFAGTLDYTPNAEALQLLVEQIEPLLRQQLPPYKIIICGRYELTTLPKLPTGSQIIYAGVVDDIDLYFAAADCFLNPVRNIHGIQTKLLDAVNYNLNVICFAKAAENLPTYLATKIFLAAENDFNGFADAVLPALSATFDTAEAFYHDFGWEAIVSAFVRRLDVSA